MLQKVLQETIGKKDAVINYFNMFSDIDDSLALGFTEFVLSNNMCEHEERPDLLVVFINSKGGDLHSGWTIIEMMRGSSIPIVTIALGQIASCALAIFMSGEKGKRLLTENTSILSHNFSTGVEGNYNDLMAQAIEHKLVYDRLISHYVKCTGLTKEIIKSKLLSTSDSWLSTKEAITYGMADKVINLK